MEKRARFASDYLMILKAIEAIYDEQKDNESTALYSQKILKADPFDENSLRKLMTLHAGSGNLTELKKMYMHHIKAAEEMDCPVSAEITEMYKRLNIMRACLINPSKGPLPALETVSKCSHITYMLPFRATFRLVIGPDPDFSNRLQGPI